MSAAGGAGGTPAGASLVGAALEVLARYVSAPTARSVLDVGLRRANLRREAVGRVEFPRLLASLEPGLRLFLPGEERVAECLARLGSLAAPAAPEGTEARDTALVLSLRDESDVARARAAARALAVRLGFTDNGATRLATVVSELARNVVRYAGSGEVAQRAVDRPERGIEVTAHDRGPGIADLESILAGTYRSATGMGLGLRGVKRLSDFFRVETAAGQGTRVTARMRVQ